MAESNRLESGHPSDGIVGSNPTLSDSLLQAPPGAPYRLRWTQAEDASYLRSWLLEPDVLRWFPMINELEVDDAIRFWMPNALNGNGITAVADGQPVGLVNLNRHPFKKLAHHALLSIIVAGAWRGRGLGTVLLHNCIRLAEAQGFQLLVLEVYEGNPAQRLYERVGFQEIGRHENFIKEPDGSYRSKIIMQYPLGAIHGRS